VAQAGADREGSFGAEFAAAAGDSIGVRSAAAARADGRSPAKHPQGMGQPRWPLL
jgi:hypothetical protein